MAQLISSILPNPPRKIHFIAPTILVIDCIKEMINADIGALVVRDTDYLIGIVSERDIVRSCLGQGLDVYTATAGEITYKKASILQSNDPIEKAMEVISNTRRRHVLIEEQNEIIALLSIGDLLHHNLEEKNRIIEQLEHYIQS